MLSSGIKCYHLGCNVIIWSYCYYLGQMLSSGIKCYHLEIILLILSSEMKFYHLGCNVIIWSLCYHLGQNFIIWDEMLSSGANITNIIIWNEILSSGMQCYHLELMLSSGANVIIWDET
jgi:hypothetical protein